MIISLWPKSFFVVCSTLIIKNKMSSMKLFAWQLAAPGQKADGTFFIH